MKKLLALLLALAMVACMFAGCANDNESTEAPTDPSVTAEPTDNNSDETEPATDPADDETTGNASVADLGGMIAFITDTGTIDDHSFNQYTWEGITKFGNDYGIETNYYKPTEDSDQARVDAMNQAIGDGAKVVTMAGFLFGTAVAEVAEQHPDILFLALDVSTDDLPGECPANVALITYQEEQSGYLAGYAAVKAGYKELGFLGGIDVPAVIRYGYGFVQGADAAAAELGVNDVNIKYWYSGSFNANDEIQTKMTAWYTAGTEVVFSCGGGIYSSAIAAADANDGYVIGVDTDQSNESERVITSAMKALSNSVQLALRLCGENGWAWPSDYSGQQKVLGAADDCVGLPMENSSLGDFDTAAYEELFQKIVDGTVSISDATDTQPTVTNVTVDYQ